MTHQPHLWDDSTATITSTQAKLFDPNDVAAGDTDLSCSECGRLLVRTGSGYLVCPLGHGRLLEELGDAERSSAWFEDDLEGE